MMKENNLFSKTKKSVLRVKEVYKERGVGGVYHSVRRRLIYRAHIWRTLWYYKIFRSSKTFTFQGSSYSYFFHEYNRTWRNPRAVEIPIVWRIVEEHRKKVF